VGLDLDAGVQGVGYRDDEGQLWARLLGRERAPDAGGVASHALRELDQRLVFVAPSTRKDIARQFAAIQARLIKEPMIDYINPVGGGYLFAPPGAKDRRTLSVWVVRVGSGLIA
jgi:hypothetical protein